jgi:hypothetical protein
MTSSEGEIPRTAWQSTLDALTKEHENDVASIEVVGLDIGDQSEAEHIPFAYIEYDPHDDAANVGVGGLDGRYPALLRHEVAHPQSIFIRASPADEPTVLTIEIRSSDESVTLVSLHPRAELPA